MGLGVVCQAFCILTELLHFSLCLRALMAEYLDIYYSVFGEK